MLASILKGSIGVICGVAVAAATGVPGQAAQNLAQPPPQASTPPPASTPTVPRSPTALSGVWKFNKDLSSDTSKLDAQANSPQGNGGSGSGSGGGRRGFGGFGGRGRPSQSNTQQGLETRALIREMAEPPNQITMVVTDTTTTFTDDQGVERKFTTDGNKEKIDLGTAQVDSVSKWNADVLTVEMTGGNFKLTETYQLTVQGHELVETLSSTSSGNRQGSGLGTTAVPIKFVFDRADAGGGGQHRPGLAPHLGN